MWSRRSAAERIGIMHPRLLAIDGVRAAVPALGFVLGGALLTDLAWRQLLWIGAAFWFFATLAVHAVTLASLHAELTHQAATANAALHSLSGLFPDRGELHPLFSRHAMDADSARALADAVVRAHPTSVVELGPGTSSVVLGRVLPTPRAARLVGLEHDPRFVSAIRERIEAEVEGYEVIEAPLEEWAVGSWQGKWYARRAVEQLPDRIDLLVVDGPQGNLGPLSRYPAVPVLADRLATGSLVFVDDVHRLDERRVVDAWLEAGLVSVVVSAERWALLRREDSSAAAGRTAP